MNIKKIVSGLLGVATMTALLAGASLANSTIASVVETNGTSTDFTFSGGAGGVFTASGQLPAFAIGPSSSVPTAFFFFGPMTALGPVGPSGEPFGPTSFFISSTNAGTGDLLRGTSASEYLSSSNGSSGSVTNITLNGVTYTGGTFLSQFLALNGGTGAFGNLSISLSGINPNIGATLPGNFYPAFTAQGSVATFDATSLAVPEPTSVAAFAFTGFGLAGLMLRARKSRVSRMMV